MYTIIKYKRLVIKNVSSMHFKDAANMSQIRENYFILS